MRKSSYLQSCLGISLLFVGAAPGCITGSPNDESAPDAPEVSESAPDGSPDEQLDTEEVQPQTEPLAKIEDETGSIEWLAPAMEGDGLEVLITTHGLAAPIVHPDIVDRVGAIRAFMAASDRTAALPESLRPFATEDDLEAIADENVMNGIRTDMMAARAQFSLEVEAASEGVTALAGEACTAGERAAARSGYGAAYTASNSNPGTTTCGDNMPFHNATGTVYYCDFGACQRDYGLPLGSCGGIVDEHCTTVGGRTTAQRLRAQLSPGSGAHFGSRGTRYRFGYRNCDDQVPAVMKIRRGSGSWTSWEIPANGMQIRVGGNDYPPTVALVLGGLGGSTWYESKDWTTSTLNEMQMVSNLNGYMCGDVIQKFNTYEANGGACNGYGNNLCDDSTCTGPGNCFD